MIRVLVIEDEIPARRKLLRMLSLRDTEIREAGSLQEARHWLENQIFDVIVSDIEVLDGNIFTLFSEMDLSVPILFTTAYDHFWTNAFETRGIDYLLKPYTEERFTQAWDKFLWMRDGQEKRTLEALKALVFQPKYKSRFAVSTVHGTYYLQRQDISFIVAEDGVVFAYDMAEKRHLLHVPSLKEMEDMLDPTLFFRINRSEMVNKEAVEKTDRYDKNSLLVYIRHRDRPLKTSQSCTAAFRAWLEK